MHGVKVATGSLAVLAYSWWATGLRPFAATSAVVIIGAGMVAMVLGSRCPRRRQRPAARPPFRAIAAWAILVGALAAWQVAAYLQHPRSRHPTLSSLANALLDPHPVRALCFALWLAGAARLARR